VGSCDKVKVGDPVSSLEGGIVGSEKELQSEKVQN